MNAKGAGRLLRYGIKRKHIPKDCKNVEEYFRHVSEDEKAIIAGREDRRVKEARERHMKELIEKKRRWDALGESDKRYERDKQYLAEIRKLSLGDGFEECIRLMTEDGLELAMFAYGIMRTEGEGEFKGCKVDLRAKIWACEYLTDRAYGKATTNIKVQKIEKISDEEIKKEIEILEGRIKNAEYRIIAGSEQSRTRGLSALPGSVKGKGKAKQDQSHRGVQAVPIPAEVSR